VTGEQFDPRGILDALERHRVNFVVIGGFARVVQGTDELTRDIDICPQLKAENLARMTAALDDLDARRVPSSLREAEPHLETIAQVDTRLGHVSIVPTPTGTRGWEDLRRGSTREALGGGLRAAIAGPGDLVRTLEGLNRRGDDGLREALRVIADLDRSRGLSR
jgi:hypothetical protein